MDDKQQKQRFLDEDFRDALKWLCVGAATWKRYLEGEDPRHERALGMFTAFIQARALYEFFYKKPSHPKADDDTARVSSFSDFLRDGWSPPASELYTRYMADYRPAQKRVFHLVYGRDQFSGGNAGDESNDLKNQVGAFAMDLLSLAESFADALEEPFGSSVKCSIDKARKEQRRLS